MSYTKRELIEIADEVAPTDGHVHVPTRLDHCAVAMFVSGEFDTDRAVKVREAINDLNTVGYLRY